MAQQIRLDLNQFQASGVYTLEFDQSQNIIVAPQTIRLVVGFSRTGPFNAPVFIPDLKTARTIFGEIDRNLERRGSFFHRSLEVAIENGPVFALNLLKLENESDELTGNPTSNADVTSYRSFSTDITDKNGFGEFDVPDPQPDVFPYNHPDFTGYNIKLVASYFNKERFWFPDTIFFLNTRSNEDKVTNAVGRSIGGKILNFTNLGKNPFSVLIRKSNPDDLSGFQITAREWYEELLGEEIPSYIKETDLISDYFVDVIVFQGNWGRSQYEDLASSVIYRDYFTPQGLRASTLDQLLQNQLIPEVGRFQGCLIPNFEDQEGVGQFIEDIINRQFSRTGLFCAVDVNEIDRLEEGLNKYYIDLVGHRLLDPSNFTENNPSFDGTFDFLSYRGATSENLSYERISTPDNPIGIPGPDFGTWEADVDVYDNSTVSSHVIVDPLTSGAENRFSITILDTIDGALYTGFFEKLASLRTDASYVVLDAILSETVTPSTQEEKLYTKVVSITPTVIGTNNAFVLVLENQTDIVGNPTGQETWLDPVWDSVDLDLAAGKEIQFWFDRNVFYRDITGDFYYAGVESQFWTDWKNGIVTNNDQIFYGIGTSTATYFDAIGYIKIEELVDPWFKDKYLKVTLFNEDFISNPSSTQITPIPYFGDEIPTPKTYIKNSANPNAVTPPALEQVTDSTINIVSNVGSLNTFVDAVLSSNPDEKNVVFVPQTDIWEDELKVGHFLRCRDRRGDEILSRITRVQQNRVINGLSYYRVETEAPIVFFPITPITPNGYPIQNQVEVWRPFEQIINRFDLTYLEGFSLNETHLPNNTETRLEDIYGLIEETNLSVALASRELIQYRYIIDTFNKGLRSNSGAKRFLTRLALRRQKALAIVNAPSIQEFIDSVDPIFTDLPTPANPLPLLRTRYIKTGGNLEQNPDEIYSLPSLQDGASHAGFYSPNLTLRIGNETIQVPPAAYVSNNFIRKFTDGAPFSAVAGTRRGIITGQNLTGLEYDYLKEDRSNIEPFGINPIIKTRNGGLKIFGNQTAYQRINSSLNNLHVRDILITIEDDIEAILDNYIFEFNNDTTRLQVKTAVDNYLETVVAAEGLVSFETQIDRSNNPDTIIDQNFAFLDVLVQPTLVINKFINRVTILNTGGTTTGGFAPV